MEGISTTTSAIYTQKNRRLQCITTTKMLYQYNSESAKDMMLANEDINTVLICGGYRNGDHIDFTNSRVSFMFNLSAGGGAIYLRKLWKKPTFRN